jgi:hypothetical protein
MKEVEEGKRKRENPHMRSVDGSPKWKFKVSLVLEACDSTEIVMGSRRNTLLIHSK